MRRPLLLATTLILTSAAGAMAQSWTSNRDSVFRRFLAMGTMVKGGSVQANWMADGASFWYLEGGPANAIAHRVDARTGQRTPMLEVPRLRQALAARLGHEPPYAGLPFERFTLVDGEQAVRFTVEGRDFRLDRSSYALTELPAPSLIERDRRTPKLVRAAYPATSADVYEVPSPDGRWFAGLKDDNVWLRSSADGREEPLTTGGTEERPWEVEGAKWSADGLRLAVTREDNRGVNRLPLVHWLKPVEEVEWRWFTKAGGPLPKVELHLVDVNSKRAVEVDLGDDPEPYLSIVGFTPDGSTLLVLANSREQKRLRVLAIDPATGKARVVLTETQPTFIKGIAANPGWAGLLTPLPDGKRFLWTSERDGWDHLYLYGLDGTLIKRLTSGSWPVLQVVGVDSKAGWVYFTGHAETGRPYDTHVYRVNLDGTGFRRLTEGEGQHAPAFSPNREYFLDTYSSYSRPPSVELRSADGRLIETLSRATIEELQATGWTPPDQVVVKAADGTTDLWGLLIKPLNFDPSRRYPVVEYIYGGPQSVNVPYRWGQTSLPQAVAALGFVVWVVDGRGTPERGKAFQDVVYGKFGQQEIPDHAAALRQVMATRPFMDSNRVGIFGGSWGGYMTVRALVLAPDLYKVGAAMYPVVEMFDHAAAAIEPYMGTPLSNPKGYQAGSSTDRVQSITGKLLLIHGTSDVNATFSATMKMVDAMTRANKRYDLVVLPEQNHGVAGVNGRYMLDRLWRHFVAHLKP
jgi:dipeptidyl aminopeptidase/acylaminoacyl peptidase